MNFVFHVVQVVPCSVIRLKCIYLTVALEITFAIFLCKPLVREAYRRSVDELRAAQKSRYAAIDVPLYTLKTRLTPPVPITVSHEEGSTTVRVMMVVMVTAFTD